MKSETIAAAIKDALLRFQLPNFKCCGQTYDGASNMIGKKPGVAAETIEIEPKALACHCHSHSLNLSVKTTMEQCKLLKNVIGTVGEICILVKFSPKRERLLEEIKMTSVLKMMVIKDKCYISQVMSNSLDSKSNLLQ